MYVWIPTEINPTEISPKLTNDNAFEVYLYLFLRERRVVTLVNMQESSL